MSSGLNENKRGKLKDNIVFEKNSDKFDHCEVNPLWKQIEEEKWAKAETQKQAKENIIREKLSELLNQE